MNISNLLKGLRNSTIDLEKFYSRIFEKIENSPEEIWITKLSKEQIQGYIKNIEGKVDLPLYGIPFTIKDNIDLAELPTTAACPKYAYMPKKNAFVVDLLIKAGAIPLGKTNMDQFATGLVGVRSPFGIVPNKYAQGYISGGSSSGSAVSLAYDLCAFSLGTDTAGSGRVPACFNKLIGYKPSRGLLSNEGLVPACKSLDCISVFANSADDAKLVFDVVACFNEKDAYSAKLIDTVKLEAKFTFGVPSKKDLEFFGNKAYENAFYNAVANLEAMGGLKQEVDFSPFLESAKLLYEGSWVHERYAGLGQFIEQNLDGVEDVIKEIIIPKSTKKASDVFNDMYALQAYKAKADAIFAELDFIVSPTAGTCYKTEEVLKDPIKLNSNLGYYTNYMNLLDFCAIAIPSECEDNFPFGFTVVGKKFADKNLFEIAKRYEEFSQYKEICVCGAHLKGFPLHWQLEELGAKFVKATKSKKCYKMYAIENDTKPAMIRQSEGGESFYVEIYKLSPASFAEFVGNIPAPLGIGKVFLEDGSQVSGFIGESIATEGTKDISNFGDWRAFKNSL
ncbi:MAG: allophanate hydrolase [Opitutales bacterium]